MKSQNKKVAILMDRLFEDLEFYVPYIRLLEEGVEVTIAAPSKDDVIGYHDYAVKPDVTFAELDAEDFDGVLIPGGKAPEYLRLNEDAVHFLREFGEKERPIFAICHGPQLMITAGLIKNRRVTCVATIKDDIVNAGGIYDDAPVIVDANSGTIVTSRTPLDLPHFVREMVKTLM